ncbi:MBL fold metallo-hydrolase [bacterium]|nr:MBL fold metallo-hydrolase [bacterium]
MAAELLALQLGIKQCPEKELFAGISAADRSVTYVSSAYLLKSSQRTVLIDTGFGSRSRALEAGYSEYCTAAERLAQLGIEPRQISDVIITHAHEAKIGALAYYPQARVYISGREIGAMEHALEHSCDGRCPYRPEDLDLLRRLPRLVKIKNCMAVDKHVRADVIGGYTRGFMLPTVMYSGISRVMLASENMPMYRHWQGEPLSSAWCSRGSDVRERLKMRTYTSFVLPGCDPLVFSRYPSAAPGVVRIISSEMFGL